jgi:hypothetical protein
MSLFFDSYLLHYFANNSMKLFLLLAQSLALPIDHRIAKDMAASGAMTGFMMGLSYSDHPNTTMGLVPGLAGSAIAALVLGTIGSIRDIMADIKEHPQRDDRGHLIVRPCGKGLLIIC